MQFAGQTDIGLVRKSNQDAYNAGSLSENAVWAVVCDGMGGANGGNIASETAIDVITKKILEGYQENMDSQAIKQLLVTALEEANEKVYEKARQDETLKGMGTTAVLALVQENTIHLVNVGDSRAYLLTREDVNQITRDHSIVQEMLESGEITEEQARNHPRKNIITRALGVDDTVVVDYFEIPFEEHAKLILCSDGFSGSLTPERIYHFSRGLTAERITKRAIELAKEAGGNDNITVVTISR